MRKQLSTGVLVMILSLGGGECGGSTQKGERA